MSATPGAARESGGADTIAATGAWTALPVAPSLLGES